MESELAKALTEADLENISKGFEDKSSEDVLRWAFDTFGDSIALSMSFGGASGAVLLDVATKLKPDVRVYYLDTDFLFPETYALIEETARRYGITPMGYKADLSPEGQARQHGENLWLTNPDACCNIRKVEPNARALDGVDAWITGLRRDQGQSRRNISIVEWHEKSRMVKINPVAHWTRKQVWDYILQNKVPYNKLLDHGYKSIGCTHCTRPVGDGDDERAGRWAGTDKIECGLHLL